MSWWESAYRSGRVNWDPGEYDGHLPWLLKNFGIEPCRVLDVGCGSGKSAVWLAGRGFDVVGLDLAPTAIKQADKLAHDRKVAVRFIEGKFPDSVSHDFDGDFGLILERGFLQHYARSQEMNRTLQRLTELMKPESYFYSLVTAAEGSKRYWGPKTWSKMELRAALEP